MAAALPWIIGGTAVLGAVTQYQAGQGAQDIARQNQAALNQTAIDNLAIAAENQAIAEAEANALLGRGVVSVDIKKKEIARLLAYQRVQEAVSGFRYAGTPLEVARMSAEEGELDVATIWSNALTEAESMRARGRVAALTGRRAAAQQVTQGDIMARQGTQAAETGFYGGATTLLQGVSSAYMASRGYFAPYQRT